jgi:hypothetical protein
LSKLNTVTPTKEQKPIEVPAAPKKTTFASVAATGLNPVAKKLVFETPEDDRLQKAIKETGLTEDEIINLLKEVVTTIKPTNEPVQQLPKGESEWWGDICW